MQNDININSAKNTFLFDFLKSELKANNTTEITNDILNSAYQKTVKFLANKENLNTIKSTLKKYNKIVIMENLKVFTKEEKNKIANELQNLVKEFAIKNNLSVRSINKMLTAVHYSDQIDLTLNIEFTHKY